MEKLSIQDNGCDSDNNLRQFLQDVHDPKKRKASLKVLNSIKPVFSESQWDQNLLQMLESNDLDVVMKVSSLLEMSTFTREVVKRNLEEVLAMLSKKMAFITNQENQDVHAMDSELFNTLSISAVKVCLQMIQFLPKQFHQRLLDDKLKGVKGDCSCIISSLVKFSTTKGFSRDGTWLAGTALSLLYNLDDTKASGENFMRFVKAIEWNSSSGSPMIVEIADLTSVSIDQVTSYYGQISMIHGILCIGADWIITSKINGKPMLEELLQIVIEKCLKVPDSSAKYLSFKTINQAMSSLATNNRIKSFKELYDGSCIKGLFLSLDSKFTKKLFELVRNHVEDLLDGVPQFTQKIFSRLLQLHGQETKLVLDFNKTFYKDLAKEVSTQEAWFMKGRWMLLAELIPYLTIEELITLKPHISNELAKCLTTSSLPAVSNEVYLSVLKCIKKRTSNEKEMLLCWSAIYEDVFIGGLVHESILFRQNLGQYWLPDTCSRIPHIFEHLEALVLKSENGDTSLHGHILLLKAAWQSGLLEFSSLFERKTSIAQGLESINLDLRIETFNIVCTNTKTTEPLQPWLHKLILNYVADNQNCDSAKFRQQMFSALKKLLLIVRDSSITIHRKIFKGNGNPKEILVLEPLNQQIDFVQDLFEISKLSLMPTASFQRKKMGLQIISLLTEVFIYVKDKEKRKKGSPTETILPLMDYIDCNFIKENSKWNFITSIGKDLLSCLGSQHDEIRELASNILCYQQDICGDLLLLQDGMFTKVINIASNLIDSPKYHDAESAGALFNFIASRLAQNPSLQVPAIDVSNKQLEIQCKDPCLNLLHSLIDIGQESMKTAYNDFLLASTNRPVFGNSIAISQVLKCIAIHSRNEEELSVAIQKLLTHCIEVTVVMTNILAGNVINKSAQVTEEHLSPSFADIDEALDATLKSCNSYKSLSEELGHLHCRELLLSFCWLNLKSLSYVVAEIGLLCFVFKKKNTLLTNANLKIVETFFKKTMITCRHKGVIETSLMSLTKFANYVSSIPLIWKEISSWCNSVLQSSTILGLHSIVTTRSAGIPMFIQAILSAEPPSAHCKLLDETMEHLFGVASVKLERTNQITNDLPQFNAINTLRAVFRNASLNKAVMRYVERGVLLTIQGFSSPSWSIRNASTQLLSTLVPRMLGQRLSQEESSQQSMTTFDVFFYHYPQLLELFESCLYEQTSMENDSGMKILPHLIPVLIFLSKLRSSDNDECVKIHKRFYPLLQKLQTSNVFAIRDLVAGAISSTTSPAFHKKVLEDSLNAMMDVTIGNNKIHSLYLLCLKILDDPQFDQLNTAIISNILSSKWLSRYNVDYTSYSVLIDVLVSMSKILKSEASLNLLFHHTSVGLKAMFRKTKHAIKGMPYFQKSLAHAVVQLFKESIGSNLFEYVRDGLLHFETDTTDFSDCFLDQLKINFSTFPPGFKDKLSTLFSKCIINNISVEHALSHYVQCDIEYLPQIEFIVLSTYLKRNKRLLVYVLPCVCRYLCSLPSQALQIDEETYAFVAVKIKEFSSPDVDENKRMAAATSLGFLKIVLEMRGSMSNQESVSNLLFWAVLNLLQDEDENVRTQATLSVQFLNGDTVNETAQPLQNNITLKNLFCLPKKYPWCKMNFIKWLIDVLTLSGNKDHTSDLMLFEQESSNLYAEHFVITELVCKCIANIQETMQLFVMKKVIPYVTTLNFEINEISQHNGNSGNTDGIVMERNLFDKLFKFLKIMEFLVIFKGDTELLKGIDVAKITGKLQEFMAIPSIKSAVTAIYNDLLI